jgi:predicted nucleic acid-binding protein
VKVVDASALVRALGPNRLSGGLLDELIDDGDLHAPHLVDVEVVQTLRRLVRAGALSDDRADDARLGLDDLPLTRYPHGALLGRAWELRHVLTAFDAVYVSLAEALDAPLVTCDVRLSRAPGVRAQVELVAVDR